MSSKLTTEEKILLAAGRNVVVFDQDATSGYLTKRLVGLMKIYFRREFTEKWHASKAKIHSIYLPQNFIYEIKFDSSLPEFYDDIETIMGINIKYFDKDYTQWFKDKGFSIGSYDTDIILAEDESEINFLLGSF